MTEKGHGAHKHPGLSEGDFFTHLDVLKQSGPCSIRKGSGTARFYDSHSQPDEVSRKK